MVTQAAGLLLTQTHPQAGPRLFSVVPMTHSSSFPGMFFSCTRATPVGHVCLKLLLSFVLALVPLAKPSMEWASSQSREGVKDWDDDVGSANSSSKRRIVNSSGFAGHVAAVTAM